MSGEMLQNVSLTMQFTMLQADQVVCDNTFCPEDADEVGHCEYWQFK